jgi:hypoxanthine-DNA glycosylase
MNRYEHPFKPIIYENSQILILGTFPSIKSFKNNFYYSNPKNQFWKIMSEIFNENFNSENEKIDFLKRKKIALWDIVKSCERKNSSDSNLKNIKPNDIPNLIKTYKNIKLLAFTSKKAVHLYKKFYPDLNIETIYLPSPSPAYASMNLNEKIKIYKKILKKS